MYHSCFVITLYKNSFLYFLNVKIDVYFFKYSFVTKLHEGIQAEVVINIYRFILVEKL